MRFPKARKWFVYSELGIHSAWDMRGDAKRAIADGYGPAPVAGVTYQVVPRDYLITMGVLMADGTVRS